MPARMLAVLLFLLGLAVMFQNMWPNPADSSLGDKGDGLVLVATLEHWWRVLNGVPVGGSWRQAGFFYPMANPIGLTDSYIALAIPYCLFRWCSAGPFSAFSATMAVFGAVGYWGGYALCRASGLANRVGAMLAAWIFAFGSVSLFLAGHAQTYTIMLAPLIGLCLLPAWRRRSGLARGAWGLAAGLVYGLILLSAPQTAWFGTFVGGLVLLITLLLRRPPLRAVPWAAAQAGGFILGAAIGLAATVFVNRPDRGPVQQRSVAEIEYYAPHLSDLVHQPLTELVWNNLAGRGGLLADQTRPVFETALGYGPILLLTLVVGAMFMLGTWWRSPSHRQARAVALACIVAPLLCGLIQVPFPQGWVWQTVIQVVPGASLIRTPFRIQDACVMFSLLALAWLFTRLTAGAHRLRAGVAALLFVLLVGEQLSRGLGTRTTSEVTGWFARAGSAPVDCQSFYVVPGAGPPVQWFVYQSEAMMLSQWIGLPTLNGNSSWYPDGWEPMRDAVSPGYKAAVAGWVAQNGLHDVCELDASSATWTLDGDSAPK